MKEIVEQVLKEEEEGRQRLEQARAEVEQLLAKARVEADALIVDAAAKADEEVRQKSEEAEKAVFAERQAQISAAQEESEELRRQKEKDLILNARKVFSRVIAIEE